MASLTTSNLKQEERNWLDLPTDVTANILKRVGTIDILESAERVCTTWNKICKEPAMWRVIDMNDIVRSISKRRRYCDFSRQVDRGQGRLVYINDIYDYVGCEIIICKHVVDRSQGQLVDFTLVNDDWGKLFPYIADRSSQLRRLEMDPFSAGCLTTEALMRFPLLEELNLYGRTVSKEMIKTAGRYCPMLKTLKVNERPRCPNMISLDEMTLLHLNETAIAIGQNLVGLKHLELIGNRMTNIRLQAILDNCLHLETLDLRACFNLDLKGDLGKQCSEHVKHLKLPNDSLESCPYYGELFYQPSSDEYISSDDEDEND